MKKELGENILLRKKERAEKSRGFHVEGRGVPPLAWDPEGLLGSENCRRAVPRRAEAGAGGRGVGARVESAVRRAVPPLPFRPARPVLLLGVRTPTCPPRARPMCPHPALPWL